MVKRDIKAKKTDLKAVRAHLRGLGNSQELFTYMHNYCEQLLSNDLASLRRLILSPSLFRHMVLHSADKNKIAFFKKKISAEFGIEVIIIPTQEEIIPDIFFVPKIQGTGAHWSQLSKDMDWFRKNVDKFSGGTEHVMTPSQAARVSNRAQRFLTNYSTILDDFASVITGGRPVDEIGSKGILSMKIMGTLQLLGAVTDISDEVEEFMQENPDVSRRFLDSGNFPEETLNIDLDSCLEPAEVYIVLEKEVSIINLEGSEQSEVDFGLIQVELSKDIEQLKGELSGKIIDGRNIVPWKPKESKHPIFLKSKEELRSDILGWIKISEDFKLKKELSTEQEYFDSLRQILSNLRPEVQKESSINRLRISYTIAKRTFNELKALSKKGRK